MAVRESGRKTVCLSNHKQVGSAAMMYAQDYDEHFVPINTSNPLATPVYALWPRLLQPYLKNTGVFHEPSNVPDILSFSG